MAAALREASLEAFDNLVELCLERDAAFLVIAGDVYDGAERGIRAQLRFRDGLGRLSDAGIATFVVHGNHDPGRIGLVGRGWVATARDDLRQRRRRSRAGARATGSVLAVVQGISYGRRDVTREPRRCDSLAAAGRRSSRRRAALQRGRGGRAATRTTAPAPSTTSGAPGSTTGRSATSMPACS